MSAILLARQQFILQATKGGTAGDDLLAVFRRGLGEATDMDQEKFRPFSEAAAAIDLRIDALGRALRQI